MESALVAEVLDLLPSLIQASLATVVLGIIFVGWRLVGRRPQDAEWCVHSRGKKQLAVQARPRRVAWAIAFIFSAGFLAALPLWWYRWGFRVAAICLAATAASGMLLSMTLAPALGIKTNVLVSTFFGAFARACASVLLGYFDGALRSRRLRARGWVADSITIRARSAMEAIMVWRELQALRDA